MRKETFLFQIPNQNDSPLSFELEILLLAKIEGDDPTEWCLVKGARSTGPALKAPFVTSLGWSSTTEFQKYVPYEHTPEGYAGFCIPVELACHLVRGKWCIEYKTVNSEKSHQVTFNYPNKTPKVITPERRKKPPWHTPIKKKNLSIILAAALVFLILLYVLFAFMVPWFSSNNFSSIKISPDVATIEKNAESTQIDIFANDTLPTGTKLVKCSSDGSFGELASPNGSSIVKITRTSIGNAESGHWHCQIQLPSKQIHTSKLSVTVAQSELQSLNHESVTTEQNSSVSVLDNNALDDFLKNRKNQLDDFVLIHNGGFQEIKENNISFHPSLISIISPGDDSLVILFKSEMKIAYYKEEDNPIVVNPGTNTNPSLLVGDKLIAESQLKKFSNPSHFFYSLDTHWEKRSIRLRLKRNDEDLRVDIPMNTFRGG